MLRPYAAMCVFLGVAAGGCSVYDEGLLTGGDPGCVAGSQVPPTRPSSGSSDEIPEVIFALKDLIIDTTVRDINDDPLWKSIGWNLDHVCSEAGSLKGDVCIPPSPASGAPVQEDGFRGIDNTFGNRLFQLVDIQYIASIRGVQNPYAYNLQDYAAQVMSDGYSSMLLRIRGWNGLDDDPLVTVDISQSVCGAPGTSTTPPADCAGMKPEWAGNDWFWLRDDAFINSDINVARVIDDQAYVSGRTIVMRLPDRAELVFVGPSLGLRVSLTGGLAAGHINADNTRLENLFFGGRWSKNDLLLTASSVNVCPGTNTYNVISNAIDTMLDIRSSPSDDGMLGPDGAPLKCDSLSMGVQFQGYSAHIAGLLPGPPLPNPCTP